MYVWYGVWRSTPHSTLGNLVERRRRGNPGCVCVCIYGAGNEEKNAACEMDRQASVFVHPVGMVWFFWDDDLL